MKKLLLFLFVAFGWSAQCQLYRPYFDPSQFGFTATTGGSNIVVKSGASFTNVILKGSITGVTNFTFDANQFVANNVTNISIKSGSLQTNNVWKSGSTKIMEIYTTHPQVLFGDGVTEGDAGFGPIAFALNSGYNFQLMAGGYVSHNINQVERLRVDSVGAKTGLGTAGSPAVSSFSASSSGLFYPDASTVALSGGGVKVLTARNNSVAFALDGDFPGDAGAVGYVFQSRPNSGLGYHNNDPSQGTVIYNTTNNALAFGTGQNAGGGVTSYKTSFSSAGHDHASGLLTYDVLFPNVLHQWFINSPAASSTYPNLFFGSPTDTSHGPAGNNFPGILSSNFWNLSFAIGGSNVFWHDSTNAIITSPTLYLNASLVFTNSTITVSNGIGSSGQVLTSGGVGNPTSWTDKGGAPVGTVVNTGASDVGWIPYYSDKTGTNVSPVKLLLLPDGQTAVYMSMTNLANTNLSSGDVDLFTIPAGYVGFVQGSSLYNSTNSTTTYNWQFKTNGVYYRLLADATLAATNTAISVTAFSRVLNENDTFSIHTSQSGMIIRCGIGLVSTNAGFRGVLLTSIANGNNTLYTAPSGLRGLLYTPTSVTPLTSGIGITVFNNSGATRTYTAYSVDSGDAASELNRVGFVSASASSTATSSINSQYLIVNPSGSLVISAADGTATQYAFATIFEY